MPRPRYAVTFACYNQLNYTQQCVDSLRRTGFDLSRLVVVDNGSSDGTRDYLAALPLGGRIDNRENLGCGVAWNQGALALQAEWTIVMNNDVVVTPGWLDGLIDRATELGLLLASPALIEGALDYDFDGFMADALQRMRLVQRPGARHAVCMAIHHSVWTQVGYFRAQPTLWGYEDTLFFHELAKAGVPTGIVGSSWLHHFGSVTLSEMKRERGLSQKQGLSARTSYKLLGQPWLVRKLAKASRVRQQKAWRAAELAEYGMTLHGQRQDGQFVWR